MDLRVGLWRRLSAKELMLLNCVVGEDSWESLGLQGNPTSHPKGHQSWVFFVRTDVKAETPILWPHHANSWLIAKDSDAGRDWGQEEKGTTEDEMAGWHHWLHGRESEWTPGVGDGQGGLACWVSWGPKESDMTERLIWSDVICQFLSPSIPPSLSPGNHKFSTSVTVLLFHVSSSVPFSCFKLCPSMSMGDWIEDLTQIRKSADSQVPYIKWHSTVGPLYPRVHPSVHIPSQCFFKTLCWKGLLYPLCVFSSC